MVVVKVQRGCGGWEAVNTNLIQKPVRMLHTVGFFPVFYVEEQEKKQVISRKVCPLR